MSVQMPEIVCKECGESNFDDLKPSTDYPNHKYMKCQSCGYVVWLLAEKDENQQTLKG